jgi:CO/xanthine dehydrogenase Mo-binding subunit
VSRWVGASVPPVDIVDKITGRTRYADDLAIEGCLVGVIVRSPVAHGVLREVDVRAARQVPGVLAVITAADFPQVAFGPYVPDWEVLARHKVRYVGDEVAAIAATSLEAAAEAAALVRLDIEPLPPVFDIDAASAPDAPVIWEPRADNVANRFEIERGDVDAAFAAAHLVLEGRFDTSRIYHGYLEPISVVGEYHQRDGVYELVVPTHIPFKARQCYADGLGVPIDRIRIKIPPIGGSFGAKYEMTVPMIAGALSRVAGRPVRITFDREQDALNNHPRPPFRFDHRIALDADGRFIGRETAVRGVAGGRTFWSPTVLATAVHRVDSLYDFQNMRGWGELLYLNEPPTTCMRGFGNAEALFGIEQLIDEAARRLDADPVELRMRNATREGERTMHGWFISSSRLAECASRVDELSGYRTRRHDGAVPVAERGSGVHRGVGISFGHHVSGYKLILRDFDGSSALLRVGIDGVPVLHVGEPDIGQGLSTVLSQIVADGLGVAPSDVRVRDVDSDFSPASVGSLASRATTLAGMATVKAVEALQARLVGLAAERWGVEPAACRWHDGGVEGPEGQRSSFAEEAALATRAMCGLPLIAEGVFRPDTEWPDETKYGNPSVAYPFCAHVAEVAVDTATGQAALVGYWAVHDSGTIINPMAARSQVVGAVAQGVGWALLEDVVQRDGTMRNANLLDYRIPGAGDMAEVVVEFADGYEPNGPLGAKSLAEAAINPVAAAIANAIYDAVGVRCEQLPMSPERIWWALADPAGADPAAADGAGEVAR